MASVAQEMPIDVSDVFSVIQHNGEILYSVDVADGRELLLRFGDLQRRTRDIGRLLSLLLDFHDSDWFQGDEDDDELRVIVFAHIGIIRRLLPDATSDESSDEDEVGTSLQGRASPAPDQATQAVATANETQEQGEASELEGKPPLPPLMPLMPLPPLPPLPPHWWSKPHLPWPPNLDTWSPDLPTEMMHISAAQEAHFKSAPVSYGDGVKLQLLLYFLCDAKVVPLAPLLQLLHPHEKRHKKGKAISDRRFELLTMLNEAQIGHTRLLKTVVRDAAEAAAVRTLLSDALARVLAYAKIKPVGPVGPVGRSG